MFLQVPPSVNWSSCAEPKSIVHVGTDALALLCNNVVVFHNLKTAAKSYFKGDNAQTAAGISLLAGHNRYPLFAIVEGVLRPKIFVMRYPDMEKLTTIYAPEILTYVDIAFSEYGFLAGLGGYPGYKLLLWNYRSGKLFAGARTIKKSSGYSLFCQRVDVEIVVQYSMWHKQILVWQLCHAPDLDTLNEIATIDLTKDFFESTFMPLTFWDDGCAYVVNDFGQVFWIDVAHMQLRPVYSPAERPGRRHSLYYNKVGLLVANDDEIVLIKKQTGDANEWLLEWSMEYLNGSIKKIISDYNNNVYGTTNNGNIQRLQVVEQVRSFKPIVTNFCRVRDYSVLKGIKEEVVLLLTMDGEVRMVDLIRMNIYSTLRINKACSLGIHNGAPIVAVGTSMGVVHFINYEKPRAPAMLGEVQVDDLEISHVLLNENTGFVMDSMMGFHLLANDFKANTFRVRLSLQREHQIHIREIFLLDEFHALIFVGTHTNYVTPFANELWLYRWSANDFRVLCDEFELPHNYRSFTLIQPATAEFAELMAVRQTDNVIDVIALTKCSQIWISYSLRTCHFTNMSVISGSRNVLTADTQSLVFHFRMHKKSKSPYVISRPMLCSYVPHVRVRMDECFNGKYLLMCYAGGCLMSFRLPILVDNLRENKVFWENDRTVIVSSATSYKPFKDFKAALTTEISDRDKQVKDAVLQDLRSIEKAMQELITFDISVMGLLNINFRKFCLNETWLQMLTEESRILCENERSILLAAVTDQSRIRDWIFELIKSKSTFFSTKLRSLFSNIFVQSYSTRTSTKELLDRFDLFYFYEMEPLEDEIEELPDEDNDEDMGEEEEEVMEMKPLKRYILEKGVSVYEHVMAKDFELQDYRIVTFNQMYNEEAKQAIVLTNALKSEFNKIFSTSKGFKEEIVGNVLGTNSTLQRIYSNQNCMLCLLKMAQFVPPELSVPQWARDENIERILTVDDSEIKAINRRKKAVIAAARKSGRMLLWSVDFWKRAIMIMMDGVLEKLWEEEIKKTPPPPEFMSKKQEHEYNLEDQRMLREYEHKLHLLKEDRKKYLRILKDNENKTHNLKRYFTVKLNEHIAEIDIMKMKYDFAIKHERLRLLNMKLTNFKRVECRKQIDEYRYQTLKLAEYIVKYEKLLEFFERSHSEYKLNYENQVQRDRLVERQFKGQYLNTIPQHLTQEMTKIFRRRPKLLSKLFSTAGICFEIAQRLVSKKQQKFPLPQELQDFMNLITAMDDPQNAPNQLDRKHWENFIKIRRQKIESELRLKGIGYHLHDTPKNIFFLTDEISKLKDTRSETNSALMETMEIYFDTVHNQRMEMVLNLGQVEIHANGNLDVLNNCILMHVDDINDVNDLIKSAGMKKLKAMQRVALFRRKVIFKEWEHKVVRANIEYLNYILKLVERCKITYEFLEVLRNWNKLREMKDSANRVGLLEEIVEQKVKAARKTLDRICARIDEVRSQLNEKKQSNHLIDSQIDNLRVCVTYQTLNRDFLGEEKISRVTHLRMATAMRHGMLMDKVRLDYTKILELQAIYHMKFMRTYEILPPVVPECILPPQDYKY